LTGRRVLATDAQERAVLAAIRALNGSGFEVTAVGSSLVAPGLWSRAPRGRRLAPDPARNLAGFAQAIAHMVSSGRHDVLLPGADASLLALSRNRALLGGQVRLGLPPDEVVQRVLDRGHVGASAAEVGLDPPEGRVCTGASEALAAASGFGFPLFVKPVRTVIERAGAVQRRAAVLAYDQTVLTRAAEVFGTCIVQEPAGGPVLSFAGVATDEGITAHVVSRYERTWPPDAGNVCFSETIASPPGLCERVAALVDRLQWQGLFELELIERGGGRYSAIDFNPRVHGSLSIAVAAGVPLPALWCSWLLGEDPRPVGPAREGVRYRWEDADLSHLLWKVRSRGPAALAPLRPHRGVTHAYFQSRDPGPSLARVLQLALKAPRQAINRESEGLPR
jgi:predicted ATP-grasp superfamily ATP-dependent carboligase